MEYMYVYVCEFFGIVCVDRLEGSKEEVARLKSSEICLKTQLTTANEVYHNYHVRGTYIY